MPLNPVKDGFFVTIRFEDENKQVICFERILWNESLLMRALRGENEYKMAVGQDLWRMLGKLLARYQKHKIEVTEPD